MRVDQYNRQITPDVAPAPAQGSGVFRLPKSDPGAADGISKSLAEASAVLGQPTAAPSGAEKLYEYALKASAALGAVAEKQHDIDKLKDAWVYDEKLYPGLYPEDVLKFKAHLKSYVEIKFVYDKANDIFAKYGDDLPRAYDAVYPEEFLK